MKLHCFKNGSMKTAVFQSFLLVGIFQFMQQCPFTIENVLLLASSKNIPGSIITSRIWPSVPQKMMVTNIVANH